MNRQAYHTSLFSVFFQMVESPENAGKCNLRNCCRKTDLYFTMILISPIWSARAFAKESSERTRCYKKISWHLCFWSSSILRKLSGNNGMLLPTSRNLPDSLNHFCKVFIWGWCDVLVNNYFGPEILWPEDQIFKSVTFNNFVPSIGLGIVSVGN